MSDKPRYKLKDLYNEITDGISLEKARTYRDIIAGIDRRWPIVLLGVGAMLAVIGLSVCGIVYISELISPPETPTDWEEQGRFIFCLFLGLWYGAFMSFVFIIGGIKNHIRRYIDDKIDDIMAGFFGAVHDGETDDNSETGNN